MFQLFYIRILSYAMPELSCTLSSLSYARVRLCYVSDNLCLNKAMLYLSYAVSELIHISYLTCPSVSLCCFWVELCLRYSTSNLSYTIPEQVFIQALLYAAVFSQRLSFILAKPVNLDLQIPGKCISDTLFDFKATLVIADKHHLPCEYYGLVIKHIKSHHPNWCIKVGSKSPRPPCWWFILFYFVTRHDRVIRSCLLV